MKEEIKLVLEGYNQEKIELIRIQNGDYNPTISLRLTGIDEAIKDLLTTQPPK